MHGKKQKAHVHVNAQTVDPAKITHSQLRSLSGKDFDTVASRGVKAGQFLMGGQPVGGQSQTIEGELVDMACFTGAGLKSGTHTLCARVCALKGAPVGLLTDSGEVYQVLPAMAAMPVSDEVLDALATRVRVTGNVNGRGDLRTIAITRIESR